MKPSSTRPRFPGLRLSAKDRQFLADHTRDGRAVSARTWKRSDPGAAPRALVARRCRRGRGNVPARGPARRLAVSRARRAGGPDGRSPAEAAEAPRYAPTSGDCRDGLWAAARRICALDDSRDHRGDQRRGIVADVGRETVRQVLAHHELKPWRKKNVVRPARWTLTTSTAWRTC